MVIDSSAIVAFARREPQAEAIARLLSGADDRRVSAATWFETSMILRSERVGFAPDDIRKLRAALKLEIVSFTDDHAALAVDAWERFGKGRHPAQLNFGDCITYATAKLAGEPLLYVGDDFALTDIESAL